MVGFRENNYAPTDSKEVDGYCMSGGRMEGHGECI
jgi:hypothetical protein